MKGAICWRCKGEGKITENKLVTLCPVCHGTGKRAKGETVNPQDWLPKARVDGNTQLRKQFAQKPQMTITIRDKRLCPSCKGFGRIRDRFGFEPLCPSCGGSGKSLLRAKRPLNEYMEAKPPKQKQWTRKILNG